MTIPRSPLAAWASPAIEPPDAKALAAAANRQQGIVCINLAWPMSREDRAALDGIARRVLGKGG